MEPVVVLIIVIVDVAPHASDFLPNVVVLIAARIELEDKLQAILGKLTKTTDLPPLPLHGEFPQHLSTGLSWLNRP